MPPCSKMVSLMHNLHKALSLCNKYCEGKPFNSHDSEVSKHQQRAMKLTSHIDIYELDFPLLHLK